MWTVIKRKISGVVFYCVERNDGYIAYYCDTKERAEEHVKRLASDNIKHVP